MSKCTHSTTLRISYDRWVDVHKPSHPDFHTTPPMGGCIYSVMPRFLYHQWSDMNTPPGQDSYHQCVDVHLPPGSALTWIWVQVQVLMFANKNYLPTDQFSQSRNAIFNFHNSISVLLFGSYVYVCDSRCLCVPHMCWHRRCIRLPVIKVTDASYPLELMVKEVVNHLMHLLITESRISPREIS